MNVLKIVVGLVFVLAYMKMFVVDPWLVVGVYLLLKGLFPFVMGKK